MREEITRCYGVWCMVYAILVPILISMSCPVLFCSVLSCGFSNLFCFVLFMMIDYCKKDG